MNDADGTADKENLGSCEAVAALDRLVGERAVTGGANGFLRYGRMPGRHLVLQYVDLERFGEQITGLEVIGRLEPLGGPTGTDLSSRFPRLAGQHPRPHLRAGRRRPHHLGRVQGGPAYLSGEFSDGDRIVDWAWVYSCGWGYAFTMVRR